jgi:hypothetical protein
MSNFMSMDIAVYLTHTFASCPIARHADTSHQLHHVSCRGPQIFLKSRSHLQMQGVKGEMKQVPF